MEPQSGIIFCLNRPAGRQATRPPQYFIRRKSPNMTHLSCLSPPIMSVPTYFVCPHLFGLSPHIMSVPIYYVCPHLLCLSPPIMFVIVFVWGNGYVYCHTRLYLGFSAKLIIWQVPAWKMDPRRGIIFCKNRPDQPV